MIKQQLQSDQAKITTQLTLRGFWLVLIANGLFALSINLLIFFGAVSLPRSSDNLWQPRALGLIVYTVQISLIIFLIRRFASARWLSAPFGFKSARMGVMVSITLWLIVSAYLYYRSPDAADRLNSTHSFIRFITIFLLNSIPGALIEEFLFRYLPVRYAESQRLSRRRTVQLFLLVLIFFTATHIPAYLWQYHLPLQALWSPLAMGAAFFFVYYATRNLVFTALFHAYTNNAWVIFGPATFKDYSLVIVVSIIWYFWRTQWSRKMR